MERRYNARELVGEEGWHAGIIRVTRVLPTVLFSADGCPFAWEFDFHDQSLFIRKRLPWTTTTAIFPVRPGLVGLDRDARSGLDLGRATRGAPGGRGARKNFAQDRHPCHRGP